MFQWYAEASVCYAYLVDIEPITQPDWTLEKKCKHSFERSKWWTRGWCLQELIAPQNVEFLTSGWSDLGEKFSLRQLISDITGIRLQILMGTNLAVCCAAEKMSWASTRETTRPEDVAYCLLGLFGVNMPLLYGEGSTKAFIRLQKEILAQEPEYSLLAWSGPRTQWRVSVDPAPALAVRPQQFQREMDLTMADLSQNRERHHVFATCIQKPLRTIVRWEDLVFNPNIQSLSSHSKWLKDAVEAMNVFSGVSNLVQDPTNVTNRGLHAKLFISRIFENAPNREDVLRLLAWTYIIHRDGLLCVWLGPRPAFAFADAVHTKDETASLILVPFRYLKSDFTLEWIYLRLPSPNEQQHQDLKTSQMLRREVLLTDESIPRPSLFVVAKYPNPILYYDSPAMRKRGPASLEDARLIGCFLVDFEPVADCMTSPNLFIVMMARHPTTNQIFLKAWEGESRSVSRKTSREMAAELFKRWEQNFSTTVVGFDDQASFALRNGNGVVKLRVPARPQSETAQISISFIRTTNGGFPKETLPQISSSVLVETEAPVLVELE